MKNLLRRMLIALNPEFKFRKQSYAQYGEDMIVFGIFREYLNIHQPSYLDVGAHHPFHLSNTALFYKFGGAGINIEANPDLIGEFMKHRPKDKNINIGISPQENALQPFYIMEQPELNTFVKEQAEALAAKGYPIKKVVEIPCYTLEYIVRSHCNGVFPDFLSLDVEGLDEYILERYDFSTSRPKIICVENLKIDANGRFYKIEKIREILGQNNYILIADTFLNDIFVDKKLINYAPGGRL
ncbi:FkbM family methyltransferase [Mucilaginibacter sp.]|uniref:FkbM family methyltransferase n=1 Tax=Mucilaginibacter sp. TaxID=1882438 RepID=UPI00260F9EF1|nr:FkbM family methyltransferase [Mucilaginibacter sp.]MDB4927024.1 SAM-dependent methyltransferase [Mucilaginibacter sp.]